MTAKTSKQTMLQFKPVAKKPKKNLSSEDEDTDQSISEDEDEEEVVAPRERVGRRAKGEAAQNPRPLSLLTLHEGCSRFKTMLILSCRCCQVQPV